METKIQLKISQKLMQDIALYLDQRPYREVHILLAQILSEANHPDAILAEKPKEELPE